jgi:hypothetical protein
MTSLLELMNKCDIVAIVDIKLVSLLIWYLLLQIEAIDIALILPSLSDPQQKITNVVYINNSISSLSISLLISICFLIKSLRIKQSIPNDGIVHLTRCNLYRMHKL